MFSFFSSVAHDGYAAAACIITFLFGFIGLIGGVTMFFYKNLANIEAVFDSEKDTSLIMEYILIGYFLVSVAIGTASGAFVGAALGELVFDHHIGGVLINGAVAMIAVVYWFSHRHRIWIYFHGGHVGDLDQQ